MFKFLKTNKSELLLLFSGLFLIGYALFIYFNATDLTYAAGPSKTEVRLYVLIRIITGLLYTIAIFFLVKSVTFKSHHLIIMFAIGIIGRIILLPTEPILEDDYNRYLWDGAVTAHGINPYKYPPEWFIEQDTVKEGIDPIIYRLAESSGDIIKNINHPHIRTIYPPVAQIVFAISYFANPWSTTYYKLLLLVADLIIFILLLVLLKKMILPTSLVAIYWLNPILLHEIFNSGHMDILVFPFILAGILYLFSDKFVKSVVYFSIAVGVKIWPVIFIPFVLKRTSNNKRILITSIISSLVIIVIILSPVLLTKIDDSLGFVSS